ncbi:hypothetical protein Trydic_g15816 [Trypoxylus dichotomus]
MQTVTVPSSLAVTESAGCAKRHSDSARLHAPRWNSRHTYSRYPAQATAALGSTTGRCGGSAPSARNMVAIFARRTSIHRTARSYTYL